ncbi:MAG: ribosome maturation factor RimP, partial [Candidatus Omnitrophota bacterium]
LEDCAAINHELSPLFDEIIQGTYTLEVNSPGLDRPIHTEGEFTRAVGQALKVFYRDRTGRMLEVAGELRGVRGGNVEVSRGKGGELILVPIDSVVKAVREIKFR